MRIAIATVQVPFEYGGAEFLAASLKQQLLDRGHEAEIVTIPFKWYPAQNLLNSIRMGKWIDLSEMKGKRIDRMIALKFPIYYASHEQKIVWLLHQHREAYDLWGTPYNGLDTLEHGERLRKLIFHADNKYLSECQKLFTISATVSNRLRTYNNLESTPLYHPPAGYEHFYHETVGDYVFCPARLEDLKRQHILIQALRYTKQPVKVLLAGKGKKEYIGRLLAAVEQYGLSDRVRLLGWISEAEKRKWYANALAVYYGPFQEDYGYVTLEAFLSGKPVITHVDSGGPLEFVRDGENGCIVETDPRAVAEQLDTLYLNKRLAREMGLNGLDFIRRMNLSWDTVIEQLLQ